MKESVNAIIQYTSLTMKDILDLTYIQFKNVLEGVSRRISWNMKLSLASVSPKGLEGIEELHPLYTKKKEDKVMKMSDAVKLQDMVSS